MNIRLANLPWLALALFGLAACGWAEWPPKDHQPAASKPPPPRTATIGGSSPSFVAADAVVVGRGDTVYALSRRHGVAVRSIIEANQLAPPYHLLVGQRIRLPRERSHEVRRGETLYAISRLYGIDAFELAKANSLNAPYNIQVGQRLRIPGPAASREPTRQESETAALPAPPAPPAATQQKTRPPPSVPSAPPAGGGGFLWPVRGEVISGFGPKGKGLHNDGINIAAPRGTPVVAAENGVVAYAGNELRGFGNLLLIKHADGWVSAYAHNDEITVARGATVKKGQTIARVGSTGSVTTPQLHFELRRGRKAVDPAKYLGPAKIAGMPDSLL